MSRNNYWMAMISNNFRMLFNKVFKSKEKAESAIINYLQENMDFDGDDINEACFWVGENDLKLDLMVFEIDLKDILRKNGLLIGPPPNEKDLYRVVYAIDIAASDHKQAAKFAYQIMTDPDSLAPVLETIDFKGHTESIDLAKTD